MKSMMKHSIIVLIGLVMLSACGGSDPIPVDEEALALNGDWYLPAAGGGIIVDGVDRSLNFVGFKISLDSDTNGQDKIYRTTNAGDLFSASGTWDWGSENKNSLVLSEGKTLNIQSQSSSRLVFTFTYTDGGVRSGMSGNYTSTLEKE